MFYPCLCKLCAATLLLWLGASVQAQVQDPIQNGNIVMTSTPVLTMGPNPAVPLAGLLELSTNIPTRIEMMVRGIGETWQVNSSQYMLDHSIPLLGFRPNREYTIEVSLAGATGSTMLLDSPFVVKTNQLPEDFPSLDVLASRPNRMEPGLTLFPVIRAAQTVAYTVAVDGQGVVRWYSVGSMGDVSRTTEGNFLGMTNGTIREMTPVGGLIRSWYPSLSSDVEIPDGSIPVAVERFHHEVFALPGSNLFTLSRETRLVNNFPSSETDPNAPRMTAEVLDEPVIEFSPNGQIINKWSLLDTLDPTRIGYGVIKRTPPHDWPHANAVVYDRKDESIIVSVRNQDAVIKMSRATGELIWILGPHENWSSEFEKYLLEPTGDSFAWAYHPHAPMVLSNGNILMFDNGTWRASPFDDRVEAEDNFSRAVEYAIDEQTMQAVQVWEYGSDAQERLFAPFLGDADALAMTDNVLMTFGAVRVVDGISTRLARIIEVDRNGNRLFSLEMLGVGVYRSERIASLYPPGYQVTVIPEPTALAALGFILLWRVIRRRKTHPRFLASPRLDALRSSSPIQATSVSSSSKRLIPTSRIAESGTL